MTGGELTLGALLARLEEREREIGAPAERARARIAEPTALLDGFDTAAEEIQITPKTLLELPDPPKSARLKEDVARGGARPAEQRTLITRAFESAEEQLLQLRGTQTGPPLCQDAPVPARSRPGVSPVWGVCGAGCVRAARLRRTRPGPRI
ncbi:hypothetical protein ACIA8I_32490 [Streptomyces rishiriensis]|uniref:hypothetical protein n=1 Tax=Streptomyces rishiriensis TaxID=68264 RepID=UPI0037B6FABF